MLVNITERFAKPAVRQLNGQEIPQILLQQSVVSADQDFPCWVWFWRSAWYRRRCGGNRQDFDKLKDIKMILNISFIPNNSVGSGIFFFYYRIKCAGKPTNCKSWAMWDSQIHQCCRDINYNSCSTISVKIENFRQEMSQAKACRGCTELLGEKSSLEQSWREWVVNLPWSFL